MRILVFGATRLGLSSAVVLAEHGHGVRIWDPDPDVRVALGEGTPPFVETGLDTAFAVQWDTDRFRLAPSLAEGVKRAEVILVCVQAPPAPSGGLDVSVLQQAVLGLEAALREVREPPLIVVRTPVPPGTVGVRIAPLCPHGRFLFMPDLSAPGRYLEDTRLPQRIVVGGAAGDRELVARLWKVDAPVVATDLVTAEVIGLAAQAYIATKRGFAGEVTALCDQVEVDARAVFRALALDYAIAAGYLGVDPAGGGPGGLAAATLGASLRSSPLLDAVQATTATRAAHILLETEARFGNLAGRSIAVLGLAVAQGTDAVDEGVALHLIQGLLDRGAILSAFDPVAMRAVWEYFPRLRFGNDLAETLQGIEGCIVVGPGPFVAGLNAERASGLRWVVDAGWAFTTPPPGVDFQRV